MSKRCPPAFSPEAGHGYHRTHSAAITGRGKASLLAVSSTRCKKDFRSNWRTEKHRLQDLKLMGHFSLLSLEPQETTLGPNTEKCSCAQVPWVQSMLVFRGAERGFPVSPKHIRGDGVGGTKSTFTVLIFFWIFVFYFFLGPWLIRSGA